jgi:hypothetical protein
VPALNPEEDYDTGRHDKSDENNISYYLYHLNLSLGAK